MKKLWAPLVALLTLLLAGCSGDGQGGTEKYTSITPQEAKSMMEQLPDAVVLDVREHSEYQQGHIPGAVLLPVGDIGTQTAAEKIPSLDTPVLVYCRSGNRSKTASRALAELGYRQVYEFGGILDWPYQVEKETDE